MLPPVSTALIATPKGRDEAIAQLQDHYARDHLEVAEFERRVELVERATSQAEVDRALAGLPSLQTAIAAPGRVTTTMRAVFSNVERRGEWRVPHSIRASATFGNVEIDLSTALLAPGETELVASALFGNVRIVVPEGLAVDCDGGAILGSFSHVTCAAASAKDPRRLRVVGRAVFGNIEVVVVPKKRPGGLLGAVRDLLVGR
jgi:hypothetical protein